MTSPRRRSVLRRTALVATGLAVGAVALSGCTKPAPSVSVFSGTSSVNREAVCWAYGADSLDPTVCAEDVIAKATSGGSVATVPVVPGDVIGISVDPAVADAGWYPVIGGQRLTATPITSTYYRFSYPDLQAIPESGVPLQVIAGQEKMVGLWAFSLIPSSR